MRYFLKRSSLLPGLLLVLAMSCRQPATITAYKASYANMDTSVTVQREMAGFLLPYKLRKDSMMNVVVGETALTLTKDLPECTMGNFIVDAQLAYAKTLDTRVVAAVSNQGGMRIPYIAAGPVTRGRIYELMPFDNKLTIMEIPGTVLQQLCDHIAGFGGWPVSGLRFTIKDGKATDIYVAGLALQVEHIYKIAAPDFVADGGDGCNFLISCKRERYNVFVRDILLQHISALHALGERLHPVLENRIRYVE